MKDYKILFISFVLLIFMIGAVSAVSNEETTVGDLPIGVTLDESIIDSDDDSIQETTDEPLVGTTKEIYVNDTGDDSNTGSAKSPYASIKKAISGVNSADNATIYLSEGTFYVNESSTRHFEMWGDEWDEEINALDFNFDHKTFNGHLKIIGAGADKTFVDGLSTYYFADISQNANITLKDITFTNFKNSNGGTIVCQGNLTVDNCIFNNSYASGQRGGVIYAYGDGYWEYDEETDEEYYVGFEPAVTILNSQFISSFVNSNNNIEQGGGAIYVSMSYLYLENNTFFNTRLSSRGGAGASICSSQDESKVYIINNKFINLTGTYDASIFLMFGGELRGNEFINCSNPSETYSIVWLNQKCVLENNTFINSSNSVGMYYAQNAKIDKLFFEMDNSTINFGNYELNKGVPIQLNITDDMGNIIKYTDVNLKLTGDNNKTYYAGINFNTMRMGINEVPENGIYNLTIIYYFDYNPNSDDYDYLRSSDVLTTVRVNASNDPVDLYVSPRGSDANNGSEEYPFETIQHAIDVGFEKTFTVIVHLFEGTYSGQGNVELNIANKGSLKIVGEKYAQTIIDGNYTSWFVSVSSTNFGMENLTFINGYARSKNLISGGTLKDCIVNNCSINNAYIIQNSILDNVTYINNQGRVLSGKSISNSFFENNTYMNYNNGGIIQINSNNCIIENSTFINNTATMGGVIYSVSYGFTSRNNYYANNKAPDDYRLISLKTAMGGVIFTGSVGNDCLFENDTFENNYAYCSGVIGFDISGSNDKSTPKYRFNGCEFINNSAVEGGVTRVKIASFTDCKFIKNSADYGGAISLLPYVKSNVNGGLLGAPIIIVDPDDEEEEIETLSTLKLVNVTFDGNSAKYLGNDIYLAPKPSGYYGSDYIYAIDLNITFRDLNISQLSDDLIATIDAPCDAQVGGAAVYFLLNDKQVGSAEIDNGFAKLNYIFEDGFYNITGYMDYPSYNTINNGTINVKLEGVLENGTYWISNDGSDETGNGSQANPFKSISYAVVEAGKNCKNVFINIAEGTYVGDLNTDLKLSSMGNITLIGAGIGKTIIDGENQNVFARITQGQNRFSIANLTIKNMLPSNIELIGTNLNSIRNNLNALTAPIVIDENATLYLASVEITNCRGGEAIIVNNGNLIVDNSVFTNNGLSSKGLIFGGNVNINNSVLTSNVAVNGILYKIPSLVINNSIIKNNFNLGYKILTGDVDYMMNNGAGIYTVIENTVISNDGDNSSLSVIGYNKTYGTLHPALSLAGNVIANNISVSNNYASPMPDGGFRYYDGGKAVAFGFAYGAYAKNVSVTNSSFSNLDAIWAINTYGTVNFDMDNCVFNNLSKIAYSFTPGEGSQYNITNSVFINCDSVIDRGSRSDREDPNCTFENNYWGSNDKPVVTFINPGSAQSFEPETWIVLTSEDEQTVIKNLTDGENVTAYTGNAPIRTDYADNDGALDYAVVFGPVGYLFTTDDDKNVIFNPEDAMYPFEAADPMDYRTPSVITITGLSGDLGIVGVLVDPVGNPIANATISSIIDGVNVANVTTDANGTFTVKGIKNGVLTILFNGTVDYFDTEYNLTFADAGKTTKSFINLDAIESDLAVKGRLVDDEGNPIANATITYTINGENATNVTTDADGVFQVQAASDAVVDIVFAGSEGADPVNTTLTIKGLATLRSATVIEGNNFTQNAIEYGAGERGGNFTVQLKDANGNVLANKTVLIGYNGKVLERVTNATGHASVQINLKDENRLTFAVAFLGDEDYNATMSVYLITIAKKPVTMTAAAKSFKAAAKSKKYSVTLKTVKGASADGKTYFAAGKVVKLSVNGKTYTAKTNAKGQATFNLKLTKKGKFTAKVSYAGDKTYNAVSKSVKLTIN